MTEKELIAGCIQNDRRCQNELYKKYYPLMTSIALRYCNGIEEAKHAVNYGFFTVLQRLDKYDSEYSLATFIRTILVNHLIDEFRRSKKHISSIYIDDQDSFELEEQGSITEQRIEEEELRFMLNSIPEVSAKVFNLFAIDGYKHREIAEMLSISEGTSKWHLNEARRRLKQLIEERSSKEKKTKKVSYE